MSVPWIHGVDIMAAVISLKLNMARDLYLFPVLFPESSLEKPFTGLV